MQLHEEVRGRRGIGLTPLIDVVFLLLVFFMLASTFLKFTNVRIDTAGAGTAKVDVAKVVLVHVAPEQRYFINGVETALTSLVEELDKLKDEGREQVVIVMRSGTTVDDLIKGLTTVRRSRFSQIHVVR